MTKLKLWQNSNCGKTQMWQNSNGEKKNWTWIMTTQKFKLWQNSKLKLWQNLKYDKCQFMKKNNFKGSLIKNILTPWQPMRCSLGSVLWSCNVFFVQDGKQRDFFCSYNLNNGDVTMSICRLLPDIGRYLCANC